MKHSPRFRCTTAVKVAQTATATALAAALLAGCASAPATQFYELSATRSDAHSGAPTRELVVDEVRLPDALNRSELVLQKNANESQVLDGQRWLSPLDDQIYRAVIANLQAALPDTWVSGYKGPVSALKRFALRIEVQQLTVRQGGNVVLAASWTISGGPAQAVGRGREVIEVALGASGVEGVAPAISDAVGQLSKRIAERFKPGP